MKRNHTNHRIGEWHGKAKHSDDVVRRARELRDKGMTLKQISSEIGVSFRTIADWVNYATRYTA